jgi:hypothetical protein
LTKNYLYIVKKLILRLNEQFSDTTIWQSGEN